LWLPVLYGPSPCWKKKEKKRERKKGSMRQRATAAPAKVRVWVESLPKRKKKGEKKRKKGEGRKGWAAFVELEATQNLFGGVEDPGPTTKKRERK